MKKKCVFKVSAGDDIYRVEEQQKVTGKLFYVVVNRRKMVEVPNVFNNVWAAALRAHECAYASLSVIMDKQR